MSILGKLFGTEKALDKGLGIIDKSIGHIASGLDSAFFTDQEKVGMRMDMVKSLQDEFTPRAITRRILALIIFGLFFLHSNMWIYFAWRGNEGMAITMKELVKVEVQLVMLVAFFYYGYYGIKQIRGK